MNPFYKSLEVIWKNPKFVFINEKRLKEIAQEIIKEKPEIPNWRLPVYYPDDDKNFVQFVGVLNSINFAFSDFRTKKKFKIEYKDTEWRVAFGMVGSLSRAMENGFSILDARFLARIPEKIVELIFRPVPGYPIPMIKERTQIFQEIGQVLLEKYDGSFYNLFKRADFRAFGQGGRLGIVDHLRYFFPSFNDISFHSKSQTWLQFHKRSQLLLLMYQGRALDSCGKLPLIQDMDDVGAIADYQIPRILEHLGSLVYEPYLRKKILDQKLIKAHTLEEQEIRAMTVLAVKKIMELTGYDLCSVDYRFWKMVRGIKTPHHLTRTIFY